MTAPELYHRAIELGLRLEPAGDMLAIRPKGKCPSDFAAVLKEHKPELLAWLSCPPSSPALPLDQAVWLPVARQVLAGEFDDADFSMARSLFIGLRNIPDQTCQQALTRLKNSRVDKACCENPPTCTTPKAET